VLGESKVVSEVNNHFIRKYQRKQLKLYPSLICITDAGEWLHWPFYPYRMIFS